MEKTEGNSLINDYPRDFAAASWCHFLAPHVGGGAVEVGARVAFGMSGRTEGVLSPHFTVFTRRWLPAQAQDTGKRLVVGIVRTRDFFQKKSVD